MDLTFITQEKRKEKKDYSIVWSSSSVIIHAYFQCVEGVIACAQLYLWVITMDQLHCMPAPAICSLSSHTRDLKAAHSAS